MSKSKPETTAASIVMSQESALKVLGEMARPDANASLVAHNFDTSDPTKLYEVMSKATGGEASRASNTYGDPVELVHWFAHMIELKPDDTRDARWTCRTVFFLKDGTQLAAVSTGVLASLTLLVRCHNVGPYSPPLAIRFYEQQTGGGRKFIQFGPAKAS